MLHCDPSAGHFGILRTLHRVRLRFYLSREMLYNGAMNAQLVRYIIQLPNNQKLA